MKKKLSTDNNSLGTRSFSVVSPHIPRIFSARFISLYAHFCLIIGFLLLGSANIYYFTSLPRNLQGLLAQPVNASLLNTVLTESGNPQVQAIVVDILQQQGRADLVQRHISMSTVRNQQLDGITALLQKNPLFVDGYGYKTMLLYRNGQCNDARNVIAQARTLDPLREDIALIEAKLLASFSHPEACGREDTR
ncbi:hypothetical protein COU89_00500 [Candidatus Roizmanbacteria bacterium CG10_big_fil_rev_8_21_14_0_10_45_7]|uniref:Uncharacterized protein n=1 Tax=Candidatus Roizmanbacteria bacterium CG10_big_fil_rev_8_21_14_0_10_45_7 TaxID=1974854 RepID=A0A2M8KVJ4_9BACT|nr:MAG: hypothetical protein COU89_00500 [Candidatus Roizmanbacteria bacterium CG10_big_fil_rev_8_21_14_0_10_45_7]